ncbi:TIGR00266 family protein, partial [Streptococcus suis]
MVEIALEAGESAYIQQGIMVYNTQSGNLNKNLNARRGTGFAKLMGSIGR